MAEPEITKERTTRRVVGVLAAHYFQQQHDPLTGKLVRRILRGNIGEEIEIPETEEKRLDGLGALLPEGADPQAAFAHRDARLDAYRGQRGDGEALERHQQRIAEHADRGDVVNVDAGADESSAGQLADWIKENRPNAEDTIALAENDPAKARKVLEAERLATGGAPRGKVEQGLSKVIAGQQQ